MEKGYEQMAIVAGSFQEHVRKSQIDDPVMYALSARDAAHSDQPAPWNQFPAFRQQIFQRREMKQITAIKAANLDEEVRQVLSVLEKEVRNLEGFERILDGSEKEREQHRLKWVEAGQQAIDLWLGKYVRKDILSYRADPDCLVGPGRALAVILLQLERRMIREDGGPAPLSSPVPSEEIALTFQRHAKWLEDRLNHRILRMNLPSSFRAKRLHVSFLAKVRDLSCYSAVILPGSKNTRSDLKWLIDSGWAEALTSYRKRAGYLLGICGGYQMIGHEIHDPEGLEGNPGTTIGLRFLPVETTLVSPKITTRTWFCREGAKGEGYEIHMGKSVLTGGQGGAGF
jgi:hypothetical protein